MSVRGMDGREPGAEQAAEPCTFCGMPGGARAMHLCWALTPPCRFCLQPVGWTGHICPNLRFELLGGTGDAPAPPGWVPLAP
jgi:hypothetical protein